MRLFICLLALLFSSFSLANDKPSQLQTWTLLDQYEQPYTFIPDSQVLLIASSMNGAKLLHASLAGQPAGYLEARNVVFLADISRMPSAVAHLFALPAMRDYPYLIILDRHARISPRYPDSGQGVLWLSLKDGQINQQQHFNSAAKLSQALAELATP